jgi:hypothetical protein
LFTDSLPLFGGFTSLSETIWTIWPTVRRRIYLDGRAAAGCAAICNAAHWRINDDDHVHPEAQATKDFLPLNGTDYVEFYVGNARQSAYYLRLAFGHQLVASCLSGQPFHF